MKANVNEVWELIDSLTLEEKKIIYKGMGIEINTKLLDLIDRVNERAEDKIKFEDITKEIEKN